MHEAEAKFLNALQVYFFQYGFETAGLELVLKKIMYRNVLFPVFKKYENVQL